MRVTVRIIVLVITSRCRSLAVFPKYAAQVVPAKLLTFRSTDAHCKNKIRSSYSIDNNNSLNDSNSVNVNMLRKR